MQVTIDRIEEGTAVLLIRPEEKDYFHLPIKYLPEAVQEGDILNFSIKIDNKATEEAEKRVKNLLNKLQNKNNDNSRNK